MLALSGYEIAESFYRGTRSILYRGNAVGSDLAVVIKIGTEGLVSDPHFEKAKREFDLGSRLDHENVIRYIELLPCEGGLAIVEEDFGARALAEVIGEQGLEISQFLNIALQIVRGLAAIHSSSIIHKDLNPHNIVINPNTNLVKIIDFSISSDLGEQLQPEKKPDRLNGTLSYIAPEQTGRMQRAVDTRADLYSLGVTFYEMLSGRLPFEATDPMELVHCHIARPPTPLYEVKPSVPPILCHIVDKLLQKNAEDRYQRALALLSDLQQLHEELAARGRLTPFELGTHDHPLGLVLPGKLYGRQEEAKALDTSYEHAKKGGTELLLVKAKAGEGKSALVHDLKKVVMARGGYFIWGKFDSQSRNIAYSALSQAFQTLVTELMGKPEQHVNHWRKRLGVALGPYGQIIVDFVKGLEILIGPQPPVAELPPTEARDRFEAVFQRFVRVFARPDEPLVLFLDDLQWADSASLHLLKLLATDSQTHNLLLIGAFRADEMDAAHPLASTLQAVRSAGTALSSIELPPLSPSSIRQFVQETLRCSFDQADELSALIYEKTAGNIFFAREFLVALSQQNLLRIDSQGAWRWDMAKLSALEVTDNVVELLTQRLQELSSTTQSLLKRAACIGGQIRMDSLCTIFEMDPDTVLAALRPAQQAGILIFADEAFRFAHDRLQETAYSLIPIEERAALHRQIGRLLLNAQGPKEWEERDLFDVTSQLNQGADSIIDDQERCEVAALNLRAAESAGASTAFGQALHYYSFGIALLDEDLKEKEYQLAFDLARGKAEALCLVDQFEEGERRLHELVRLAENKIDKAEAYRLQIAHYSKRHRSNEAIHALREALSLFGIELPSEESAIKKQTKEDARNIELARKNRSMEQLLELPPMKDRQELACLQLLCEATYPLYFFDRTLMSLVIMKMMAIFLRSGNTVHTPEIVFCYGGLLGVWSSDFEPAYRHAKLALDMLENQGRIATGTKLINSFAACISHWRIPFEKCEQLAQWGKNVSNEAGDHHMAWFCYLNSIGLSLARGVSLQQIRERFKEGADNIQDRTNEYSLFVFLLKQQFVNALRGDDGSSLSLLEDDSSDSIRLRTEIESTKNPAALFHYFSTLELLAFLNNDAPKAIQYARLAESNMGSIPGLFPESEHRFYHTLILSMQCQMASEREKAQYIESIEKSHQEFRVWAENCPDNYLHKHLLIAAELKKHTGDHDAARDLYDQGIESARKNGFTNIEAIGNELAANFALTTGKENLGRLYIAESARCYAKWGATAKVKQLEESYPQLTSSRIDGALPADPTSSASKDEASLDLGSVLKASQAISREIDLRRLLTVMMKIMMENAGAQRGFLLRLRDGQPHIEAAASVDQEEVEVLQAVRVEKSTLLPASLIRYVVRKKQPVVVHDGLDPGQFTSDPYFQEHQPQSFLCMPLSTKEKVTGALYLENRLTRFAFTEERLEVLDALLSQAAIAIENAELFDLQVKAEEEMRRLRNYLENIVNSMPSVLVGVDAKGRVTQWNREAETKTGISSSEAAGRPVEEVLPWIKDELSTIPRAIRDCEVQIRQKVRRETKEGLIFFDLTVYPLKPAGVEGAVIRIDDITERVQLEEMMIQSEKMMSLGSLAAGMAHEINNPIGGILQTMQVIKNRSVGDLSKNKSVASECGTTMEAIKAYVEKRGIVAMMDDVKNAGERAATIIDNTLGFSRKSESKLEPHSLSELLDSMVNLASSDHSSKKKYDFRRIKIIREYDPELPKVPCDRSKIQQVLLNLLTNGAQAMAAGTGEADASPQMVLRARRDGTMARIEVEDNGPGMDEATRKQVFEPFFTTKEIGVGTGLGLSVSYFIITKNHRGTMTVESSPGNGAKFVIRIPLSQQ